MASGSTIRGMVGAVRRWNGPGRGRCRLCKSLHGVRLSSKIDMPTTCGDADGDPENIEVKIEVWSKTLKLDESGSIYRTTTSSGL